MNKNMSELTEVSLAIVEQMKSFSKSLAQTKPIPFGMEKRPKPKNPDVVPLKRGGFNAY